MGLDLTTCTLPKRRDATGAFSDRRSAQRAAPKGPGYRASAAAPSQPASLSFRPGFARSRPAPTDSLRVVRLSTGALRHRQFRLQLSGRGLLVEPLAYRVFHRPPRPLGRRTSLFG